MASLEILLEEAEKAYHDLQIGKAVVEFRDENGEMVRYSQANSSRLAMYISDLKRQIANLPTAHGPMRVFM